MSYQSNYNHIKREEQRRLAYQLADPVRYFQDQINSSYLKYAVNFHVPFQHGFNNDFENYVYQKPTSR